MSARIATALCALALVALGCGNEQPPAKAADRDYMQFQREVYPVLLRDCGSAADTAWIHYRDDLPRLIRAGRHLARTKRYIRDYAHEVEPPEPPAYVEQEAKRGDGWVKLVGDWIDRLAPVCAPLVVGYNR